MKPEWRDTLLQCLGPISTLVLLFVVRHIRDVSWRDDIGVRWPSLSTSLLWIGAFVVLSIAKEVAAKALGLGGVSSWSGKYSIEVALVSGFVIIAVAPVAEELMFRGLLFSVLSNTRFGPIGAVALTSVLFTLVHIQYGGILMLLVLVDAVFFGVSRLVTGSVLIPLVCHMLGNCYAVYERMR
jgi:membrane protease YdiL (CAAX protease family)